MVRSVVVVVLALLLPASALAQSAGDQQYQDPFGKKSQPAATATAAATTYATSAPTYAATAAPTYEATAVPTEDPQIAIDAGAKAGRRVGKQAKPPVTAPEAKPIGVADPDITQAAAPPAKSTAGGGGTTVGIVIIIAALVIGGGVFAVRRTRGGSVADA